MVKPFGLYDHESVSIVERNLQTPFNSLIMAGDEDNQTDSIYAELLQKAATSLRLVI